MNFERVMAGNPPRLVVQFARNGAGDEEFEWGVVGNIPILSLIGHVASLQAAIIDEEWIAQCPVPALVITYDRDSRTIQSFCHIDIPRMPLVGMLELIKALLTGGRMAQHAAAQRFVPPILGPDGRPIGG